MEYSLERFVMAQTGVYDAVLLELRRGEKETHWMWYIFPQLAGLGRSRTARSYAISSIGEARAYLAHPILGARLIECTSVVNGIPRRSLGEIFGAVDAMKFRSCMTLFREASPEATVFEAALQKYCEGRPDAATLALLSGGG